MGNSLRNHLSLEPGCWCGGTNVKLPSLLHPTALSCEILIRLANNIPVYKNQDKSETFCLPHLKSHKPQKDQKFTSSGVLTVFIC